MLKVKHRTLIFIAGLVWLGVGIFLLYLGIHFVLSTIHYAPLQASNHFSIVSFFSKRIADPEQIACIVVSLCIFLGYLKGRLILSKSVKRQVNRIISYPTPVSIFHIYSPGYYVLILSMMGLGMAIRYLPISIDTRGAIDLAIGSALINGAMHYFRYATTSFTNIANPK